MKNYRRGFTLIELLVVIAIIGLLSSIVLASLNSARQKAEISKVVQEMKSLQIALEIYNVNNNYFPSHIINDTNWFYYGEGGFANGLNDLVTNKLIPIIPEWDTNKFEYYYAVGEITANHGYTCGGENIHNYVLIVREFEDLPMIGLSTLDTIDGYYCLGS